ncbi:MAG: hypothetical protein KAX13_06530, partial [Candidatus Krumholzibacteria bacterium]|nr:hypothetical protein [Candidatus Krumholzibacteria bacterium]
MGLKYPVQQFFEETAEEFDFEMLSKDLEGKIPITSSDIHRPAFALTGFMENYLHERIQILGDTELLYLRV